MNAYVETGSVSSGTLRPEDLIPAFIAALDDIKEAYSFDESVTEADRVDKVGRLDDMLAKIETGMEAPGYWDSEEVAWDMDSLMDELNSFAPEGHYFGGHPGDPADFGFWQGDE